jgi:hypothetical protein
MPSLAEIESALRNADAAGDVDAARALAAEYTRMQSVKPDNPMRRAGAGLAKSNPIATGYMNAAQGPLMNFADEIGATGAAAIDRFVTQRNPGFTFDQLRDRYLDVARGANKQYETDNPVLAPMLQAGAGIATGIGAARMLPGAALPTLASVINPASVAGRVGVAALGGAGYGAVGGAGSAETMADVPEQAGQGAAFGALTGGILNAAGQGAGALGRNVVSRAANTQAVQSRVDGGGIGGGVADKIDSFADDLARRRILVALERDNPVEGAARNTVAQAQARLAKFGDNTPMALAGAKNARNTVGLLDTMATMPGRTTNTVESAIRSQQAGSSRAILSGSTGLAGGRQFETEMGALIQKRADDSKPLYDAIREIPIAADGKLQTILQRPVIQDAIAQARVSAANADTVLPDIKGGEAVPMHVWDKIKRGLDDVISAKKRGTEVVDATNRAKSTLADATRTKAEFLKILDTAVPDYEKARNAFSGPSALKDAMEEGRAFFNLKPLELKEMIGSLSASEQDAFRVGAAQALKEKVGNESGRTSILKFWKEDNTRERLQAIFPDTRSFREFQSTLLARGLEKPLEAVGRGSATVSRQARTDDEGAAAMQELLSGAASAKTGNLAALYQGVRNLYGRTVMPEPVRDRIGQMLLTRGPEAQGLLGDLSRYADAEDARRAAAATRSGLLGGSFVNALGN